MSIVAEIILKRYQQQKSRVVRVFGSRLGNKPPSSVFKLLHSWRKLCAFHNWLSLSYINGGSYACMIDSRWAFLAPGSLGMMG